MCQILCVELELHGGGIHPREDQQQRDQHRCGNVENHNREHYDHATSETGKSCDRQSCHRLLPNVADLPCLQIAERCFEFPAEALLQILAECEFQSSQEL